MRKQKIKIRHTQAASKIRVYMLGHELTDEAMAKKLKCSKHSIRKYKNGTRRAEDDVIFKINDLVGLTLEDWYR